MTRGNAKGSVTLYVDVLRGPHIGILRHMLTYRLFFCPLGKVFLIDFNIRFKIYWEDQKRPAFSECSLPHAESVALCEPCAKLPSAKEAAPEVVSDNLRRCFLCRRKFREGYTPATCPACGHLFHRTCLWPHRRSDGQAAGCHSDS